MTGPNPASPIPVSQVDIGDEERRLVLEVLDSGRLAQGPMVERFEAACAAMAGTAHAVAVSSGTTALVAAVEALGLGEGDEVVTTPFTFVATANAVLESGATVRLADIGPDANLDPEAAAAAVTGRTRALLPVHLYGLPADMDALVAVADRHGLAVVEDAAQAHGARVGERPVGGYGLAAFSFYATKNVTTGEGGVVTTDDAALADRVRVLRNQGMRARYDYELAGHNWRMTELQAALGVAQLGRLGEVNQRRRENAAALTAALGAVADRLPGVALPGEPAGRTSSWHQYTVRIGPGAPCDRDAVADHLAARGISAGIYYPSILTGHDVYRSHPRVRATPCPRAEQAAAEVLSLPVHPGVGPGEIVRIVDAMVEAQHGR